MQRMKADYNYISQQERQTARRQWLGNLFILLIVLGLGAACAVAYYHARGGFLR